MIAYHVVSPNELQSVLTNGLRKTSRGDKGADPWIVKADALLDERRPKRIKHAGVSRDNNIYAYVCLDELIIDIVDGSLIPVKEFISKSSDSVLKLTLDSKRCYVSDLDTYDALKQALQSHKNPSVLETLAKSYWDKLTPLESFQTGMISRPEIMITYDVTPLMLEKV